VVFSLETAVQRLGWRAGDNGAMVTICIKVHGSDAAHQRHEMKLGEAGHCHAVDFACQPGAGGDIV